MQGVTSAPAGVSELSSVPDGACSGPARSPAGRWEQTQVSRTLHAQHAGPRWRATGRGPSRGPQGPLCPLLPPPHCLSCFSPSSTLLTLESPDTVLSWGLSTCSSPGACLALSKAALKGYLLRPLVNCSSPSPTSHARASPPPRPLSSTFPSPIASLSMQCSPSPSPPTEQKPQRTRICASVPGALSRPWQRGCSLNTVKQMTSPSDKVLEGHQTGRYAGDKGRRWPL